MANIDYDFAWAAKFRYDVLLPPIVARTRALLVEVADRFGATILGTARVQNDFIHVRVRADENVPVRNLKRYMKGVLSFALMNENADIKQTYGGRMMFDRDTYRKTGNPNNSEIDALIAKKTKHTRP